jgi:hypothetical protein
VPTLMQVRSLAHFDGREPRSDPLDRAVNVVSDLPLGHEDVRGWPVRGFTAEGG